MRALAILLALTFGGSWAFVQGLPEGRVHAETRVIRTQEIHSISIDGGRGLPVAQLRDVMATKLGENVDTAKLGQDRVAIQTELASRGYLAAKVSDPVVTYGPSGGVYIVFDVERGPLFHIRTITLVGPNWKDVGVVTLAPGDEAVDTRLQRVRQTAQDTISRLHNNARVDLLVIPDVIEHVIDVRLITR
jgi:Surface antigen variable number repeat